MREHKFRHNFQDSLEPFCNCGRHIETTIHFFLLCSNYSNQRKPLFEKISNIKRSLLNQNYSIIVETLIFGSNGLNDEQNECIIESKIEYIMNPFKQTTTFLEISNWFWITLCHTLQLFSCSIFVIYIYIYINFIFNALLNVYYQGYVVYNLFFLIFFFFIVYNIFIEKKLWWVREDIPEDVMHVVKKAARHYVDLIVPNSSR